eukprot:106427-Rhodomonas_salina.2
MSGTDVAYGAIRAYINCKEGLIQRPYTSNSQLDALSPSVRCTDGGTRGISDVSRWSQGLGFEITSKAGAHAREGEGGAVEQGGEAGGGRGGEGGDVAEWWRRGTASGAIATRCFPLAAYACATPCP